MLRPDFLGSWLPYALADIFSAIVASNGGHPPRLADLLTSWGLGCLAERMEDVETENAMDELKKIADNQGNSNV